MKFNERSAADRAAIDAIRQAHYARAESDGSARKAHDAYMAQPEVKADKEATEEAAKKKGGRPKKVEAEAPTPEAAD